MRDEGARKSGVTSIRELLKRRPDLAPLFVIYGDEDWGKLKADNDLDAEESGWVCLDDSEGCSDHEKVIEGKTWLVQVRSWLQDAIVFCEGINVSENGPDFDFKSYDTVHIIDFGLWEEPDWDRLVKEAQMQIEFFDHETKTRPHLRQALVNRLEFLEKLKLG